MPRAPKACGKPGCPEKVTGRTYCPAHTPTWVGSTRRPRLPDDWPDLRAQAERRAGGRCEADTRLGIPHHRDCNRLGSECDHIRQGDDHRPTNLCWLSTPCHRAKTARETRARNQARTHRRRTP
jgi:5-methylcytosine-specific restriction protein A